MSFSPEDQCYMYRAIELANLAKQQDEVPVGAVITLNNQVIGEGFNCPIASHDPTQHAEIMALRQAALHCHNYRLPETTLYVTLEPCLMCLGAIIHARIKRLVFGAYDLRAGAIESVFQVIQSPKLNHHIVHEGGLLLTECQQLLQTFFQQKRQK